MDVPSAIRDLDHLDALLSDPSPAAVEALRVVEGDVVILGVAGKMGPTLARMARRAADLAGTPRRIIGVSRFSSDAHRAELERLGVETTRADLLDRAALDALPDAPNVIFMAGRKFGSTGDESYTWAMNTHLAAMVCQRFSTSRIAAFSTGNVYGHAPVGGGGSKEDDAPAPIGEYAMSCLGRERMFEYFSRAQGTRVAILRLNYATEMRYGVLIDLAAKVARHEPVDLTMGWFNVIWQADANAMGIASLAHASSPPLVVNLAGPEELSVRDTCGRLATLLDRQVAFTGREASDAVLSNGSRGWALMGRPRVPASTLIEWSAEWIRRGGGTLGKPTHFESRRGAF